MEDQQKETLLFVDDEKPILDISREYFSIKGYRVITAENGLEAVEVLKKHPVDCCFTDINMPRMDGIELAEQIRLMDNTIPVIIMTGYPSLENIIHTLKNGVVDFLIKPVNLNQMEICLHRVLRERHLFIENILLKQEVEKKAQIEALNRELKGKVEELGILNRILSEFKSIRSSVDIFGHLVNLAMEITRASASRLYLIHPEYGLPVEVASAFSKHDPEHDRFFTPETLIRVVKDQMPLFTTRDMQDKEKGALSRGNSGRFMGVPLMIRDRAFGVLTAASAKDGFSPRDLYYLSSMTHTAAYAIENLALYENIYENLLETLKALVHATEARDPYTNRHSRQVARLALVIGKAMGCTDEEMNILEVAGQLHDIGKIGIQDNILLKKGRLTRKEYEIIKGHADIGADIVKQLGLWEREQEVIRHHHERFDGRGYPFGKQGVQIPFLSRILSVADVYDAMASDRIYRERIAEHLVLNLIKEASGSQFDPEIVEVFGRLFHEGKVRLL